MAGSTKEVGNKVKVSDAGPSRKKVAIEVPAAAVAEKLKTSFDALQANAALPGFRPGRVPRSLLEKRFGSAMKREAKSELVSQAFQQAVEETKLQVVGQPTADELDKVEIVEGKPFAFEVEVEVLPEFELPALEGMDVKKPILEVTDAMVNEEIEKICINEGSLESRDTAEYEDYLTGHAIMKGKDGTEFYNLNGAVVQKPGKDKNGKGMILGVMVDDFEKQMGNPKAGDTFTIKTKGPANHEVEKIQNNDLTITFKVDRIDRIIGAKPETLVESFGLESVDRLKELVKLRLNQQVQINQQAAQHAQITRHLVETVKMDLPERLTASQSTRNLERRRMELMYRGVDPQKIEEATAELRSASAKDAQRDLKLFFILFKAAEKLNIGVNENEVNARITQMAMQRNVRPDMLRQQLIQSNQVQGMVQQIRDHKTLDAILSKAKVTEVAADEYNKLMKDA